MVILSGVICCLCWGAPAWPTDGVASRDWVVDALQWRFHRGLDDCDEIVPALDAMTLEWISESTELTLEIQQSEWPFLEKAPELLPVLIQAKAMGTMLEIKGDEKAQRNVVRNVRRVVRKTAGLPVRALRSDFRSLLRSAEYKRGHRSNK
tara:strand:- start:1628 stop:2077 length:450 start_codon:yes stop_codon:yes gene_type:complete